MPGLRLIRSAGWVLLLCAAILAVGYSHGRAQSGDAAQLEEGARLYAENCAVCHGPDGQGRVGATLAKDWPSIRPDLTIRATIETGIANSPMPAWGQANGGPLSEAQIESLVAYILTWGNNGPLQPLPTISYAPRPALTPPPNVQGDPNNGGVLFDQNCAVCHGANGEGRVGATLAKSWASVRPDLSIKNTISAGIENSPMPAWGQANGGPLAEAEINDLVSFILTLPVVQSGAASPTAVPTAGPFPGWPAALLALLAFILIVAAALWLQARSKPQS
jgi:cytochrome c oxidase cbb3-type subunit 3